MDFFYTHRMFRSVNDPTNSLTTVFARALKGLLRPLVRALIAKGVTAPALYQTIKQLYVEVAETDFALDDKRQTDSRISMLTGVHRRDVKSFRDPDTKAQAETRERVTTIASVLGRWLALAKDGAPPPLPRDGDAGSFEALVQSVSRDIRPRTVLDEMLAQGLVAYDEDADRLTLNADAFLGPADTEQRVYFFAENVGDHLAAAVDNLLAEEPRFMERAVFYNRLTPGAVDALEATARRLSGEALTTLNREALERQTADLDDPEGTERFRYGVFFYRENEKKGGE